MVELLDLLYQVVVELDTIIWALGRLIQHSNKMVNVFLQS
jgi:hypothetical protein